MDEDKTPESWSESRFDELDRLGALLRECERIDSGNGVLLRLSGIIATARRLNNGDREHRRTSFLKFLREQAIHGTRT